MDNGSLSGGIIFAGPDPACVGSTITFTVGGVADTGGSKRVNCEVVSIPPVSPTYTWVITRPVGLPLTGSGPLATVVTDAPGNYSATFTATAA